MAESKLGLEKFLATYTRNQELKNKKLSFDNFKRWEGYDYDRGYAVAVDQILEAAKRSTKATSLSDESLASGGLGGSGYADYVRSGMTYGTERALREARFEKELAEEKALQRYGEYSARYDENQAGLEDRLAEKLIEYRVYNPEMAYRYAVASGATNDVARSVANRVVSSTRDLVAGEIFTKLAELKLSPVGAIELAKEYGIDEGEIKKMEELIKKLEGYKTLTLPSSYAEYLEELGALTSPTIDFRKIYPQFNY